LLPLRNARQVHVLDAQAAPEAETSSGSSAWYVNRHAIGKRRGSYAGPFDGPDGALAYMRSATELELVLLDDTAPSSSVFRIVRRLSA